MPNKKKRNDMFKIIPNHKDSIDMMNHDLDINSKSATGAITGNEGAAPAGGEGGGMGEAYDEPLYNGSAEDVMSDDELITAEFEETNGKLVDFNPQSLMDKVKKRGESLYTAREHNGMLYIINIFFEDLFGVVGPDTKYWIDIVSEDMDGNQERITTYKESRDLTDKEVVDKLNAWKDSVINKVEDKVEEAYAKNSDGREGFYVVRDNRNEFIRTTDYNTAKDSQEYHEGSWIEFVEKQDEALSEELLTEEYLTVSRDGVPELGAPIVVWDRDRNQYNCIARSERTDENNQWANSDGYVYYEISDRSYIGIDFERYRYVDKEDDLKDDIYKQKIQKYAEDKAELERKLIDKYGQDLGQKLIDAGFISQRRNDERPKLVGSDECLLKNPAYAQAIDNLYENLRRSFDDNTAIAILSKNDWFSLDKYPYYEGTPTRRTDWYKSLALKDKRRFHSGCECFYNEETNKFIVHPITGLINSTYKIANEFELKDVKPISAAELDRLLPTEIIEALHISQPDGKIWKTVKSAIKYASSKELDDQADNVMDNLHRIADKKNEAFLKEELPEEAPVPGPQSDEDIDAADALMNLIKDEYEAIQGYNEFLAEINDDEDFDLMKPTIEHINDEENKHIGELQTLLHTISPNVEKIADGKEEAEREMNESMEDEVLKLRSRLNIINKAIEQGEDPERFAFEKNNILDKLDELNVPYYTTEKLDKEYVIKPTRLHKGWTRDEVQKWADHLGCDYETALRRVKLINAPEGNYERVLDRLEPVEEDVVKQKGKWVNKGKRTHGKFATKKAALAQTRAMYANGYKAESLLKEDMEAIPFSYDMTIGDEVNHIEAAVIIIKDGLKFDDGSTMDATIFAEDEDGNVINFKSVEEAQEWINKYKDCVKIHIERGNEIHATPICNKINEELGTVTEEDVCKFVNKCLDNYNLITVEQDGCDFNVSLKPEALELCNENTLDSFDNPIEIKINTFSDDEDENLVEVTCLYNNGDMQAEGWEVYFNYPEDNNNKQFDYLKEQLDSLLSDDAIKYNIEEANKERINEESENDDDLIYDTSLGNTDVILSPEQYCDIQGCDVDELYSEYDVVDGYVVDSFLLDTAIEAMETLLPQARENLDDYLEMCGVGDADVYCVGDFANILYLAEEDELANKIQKAIGYTGEEPTIEEVEEAFAEGIKWAKKHNLLIDAGNLFTEQFNETLSGKDLKESYANDVGDEVSFRCDNYDDYFEEDSPIGEICDSLTDSGNNMENERFNEFKDDLSDKVVDYVSDNDYFWSLFSEVVSDGINDAEKDKNFLDKYTDEEVIESITEDINVLPEQIREKVSELAHAVADEFSFDYDLVLEDMINDFVNQTNDDNREQVIQQLLNMDVEEYLGQVRNMLSNADENTLAIADTFADTEVIGESFITPFLKKGE